MKNDIRKFLVFIAILLIAVAIFLLFMTLYFPNINAIAKLSGFSTFIIAFLTIIYVYTTNRQLFLMSQQIEEMKLDRELQNQPLPWIDSIKFECEKPRLYFSPPNNDHIILSRYRCAIRIKNIGPCPVVSGNIFASLHIGENENKILFKTVAIPIDALEEKQVYPLNEEQKSRFLFAEDTKADLLKKLLETNVQKYPILAITMVYKNTIGASFITRKAYAIYPKKDSINQIKLWVKEISNFMIEFKEVYNTLTYLKKSNHDKWSKLFQETKNDINSRFTEKQIVLEPIPIPSAFEVKPISQSQYEELCSQISYGFRLGPLSRCMTSQ